MPIFNKIACAALAFVAIHISPAFADEAAEKYIQGMLDEAEPFLGESNATIRYDGIEKLVDKYVDMRRIGYFTLGQYARKLTDTQRAEYFPLFEAYAKNIYQEALTRYSGEKLAVSGSVDRSDRDIIVNSTVVNAAPGDKFANVVITWRVYRDGDGNMAIVDAGADGIWLALEQRDSFSSVISNNGGPPAGIDALIAELRAKTSS